MDESILSTVSTGTLNGYSIQQHFAPIIHSADLSGAPTFPTANLNIGNHDCFQKKAIFNQNVTPKIASTIEKLKLFKEKRKNSLRKIPKKERMEESTPTMDLSHFVSITEFNTRDKEPETSSTNLSIDNGLCEKKAEPSDKVDITANVVPNVVNNRKALRRKSVIVIPPAAVINTSPTPTKKETATLAAGKLALLEAIQTGVQEKLQNRPIDAPVTPKTATTKTVNISPRAERKQIPRSKTADHAPRATTRSAVEATGLTEVDTGRYGFDVQQEIIRRENFQKRLTKHVDKQREFKSYNPYTAYVSPDQEGTQYIPRVRKNNPVPIKPDSGTPRSVFLKLKEEEKLQTKIQRRKDRAMGFSRGSYPGVANNLSAYEANNGGTPVWRGQAYDGTIVEQLPPPTIVARRHRVRRKSKTEARKLKASQAISKSTMLAIEQRAASKGPWKQTLPDDRYFTQQEVYSPRVQINKNLPPVSANSPTHRDTTSMGTSMARGLTTKTNKLPMTKFDEDLGCFAMPDPFQSLSQNSKSASVPKGSVKITCGKDIFQHLLKAFALVQLPGGGASIRRMNPTKNKSNYTLGGVKYVYLPETRTFINRSNRDMPSQHVVLPESHLFDPIFTVGKSGPFKVRYGQRRMQYDVDRIELKIAHMLHYQARLTDFESMKHWIKHRGQDQPVPECRQVDIDTFAYDEFNGDVPHTDMDPIELKRTKHKKRLIDSIFS